MTKAVRAYLTRALGEGGAESARTCSRITQSAANFEVPVHKSNIHVMCKFLLVRSKVQVPRVRSETVVHRETSFKFQDRTVGTVLVQIF